MRSAEPRRHPAPNASLVDVSDPMDPREISVLLGTVLTPVDMPSADS